MAQIDYSGKGTIAKLWNKITEKFVRKELKTDSDSQYKVLSDNNLTDELLQKINEAGVSDFGGNYSDLYAKPSIDGHEIRGGNQTSESLGLASQTWVNSQGFQKSNDVQSAITAKLTGYATQTWVNSQNFQTEEEVTGAINAALTSAFVYKGVKATVAELPEDSNKVGDIWHVTEDNNEYAWNGTAWEPMGGDMDLSAYVKATDLVEIDQQYIDETCV